MGDTYKLSIAKVGVRDYGEYYCRASNLLDRDVSAAIVLTGTGHTKWGSVWQLSGPTVGCPSVPAIKGETAGDQAYSYEVIWSVESDYSLLQHEVGSLITNSALSHYWPGCVLASAPRAWPLTPRHCPHQACPRSHGHQVIYSEVSPDQTLGDKVELWKMKPLKFHMKLHYKKTYCS